MGEMEGDDADSEPLTMKECAEMAEKCLFGRSKAVSISIGNIDEKGAHEVEEVIGTDNPLSVEGVKAKHVKTGAITEIPCKGFFVAIGHAPASELVKDQLETHMGGYVVTNPDSTATSVPGVFAAGDLTDHKYRQAVTSAGMGCMAALEAERFLAGEE